MKNDAATANLVTEITTLKSKISELETLVKFYEEQFRLSKKRQFGASSEKSEYDQLRFDDRAEPQAEPAAEKSEEPALEVVKEQSNNKFHNVMIENCIDDSIFLS